MKYLISCLIFVWWNGGLGFSLRAQADPSSSLLLTPPGPEDMVLDTFEGRQRLLVSCHERRDGATPYSGIEQIDLKTGVCSSLIILDSSLSFKNPHGLAIRYHHGATHLYVIAHDYVPGKQGIFQFLVGKDILQLEKIYHSPWFESPNALDVFSDGALLVSNDAGKKGNKMEILFSQKKSKLIYCNPSGTECNVIGLPVAYGNGVAIDEAGKKVYHAATRGNRVYVYQWDGKSLSNRTEIARVTAPDNLRLYGNGVLVASHTNPLKFLKHYQDGSKKSPGAIWLLHADGTPPQRLFEDDGRKISAPSTALMYQDKLYISQVFNKGVLRVKLNH